MLCLFVGTTAAERQPLAQEVPQKPNILFILTDDQDVSSLAYMPIVQERLVAKGATFKNFFLSDPVCCPSRATILRGQYAHNHEIWTNYPVTGGGEPVFREKGLDESTFATWLDDEGYRTALVGRYLNSYPGRYEPPGWDVWKAQTSAHSEPLSLVGDGRGPYPQEQVPDVVIADHAAAFLRGAATREQPFLAWVGFNSPHVPPRYSKVYAEQFEKAPLPKKPSFNETDVSDKPAWVQKQPPLDRSTIAWMRDNYRNRLRSLQSVDRFVGRAVNILAGAGELQNTYVVFTTDNGFHHGEHRLARGKGVPYDEAVRFPLIVRGHGVAAGVKRSELALNTDLAPTFAELSGAEAAPFVDGRSLVGLLSGGSGTPWRDAVLLEGETPPGSPNTWRSYRAVRTQDRVYVEYTVTGEKELYDLANDPSQLQNVAGSPEWAEEEAALKARLDALRECGATQTCQEAEGL